jgi:hypothetical protein
MWWGALAVATDPRSAMARPPPRFVDPSRPISTGW